MGILDKIDELTTNSVTPEEFKETWGYGVDKYVSDMMEYKRKLVAKRDAEAKPTESKTGQRVMVLPAAAIEPAAAAIKVAAKTADKENSGLASGSHYGGYAAITRARKMKQERESLVRIAKAGGGMLEFLVTGSEPLKIYAYSKKRNDRSKKRYVYTVSVGSVTPDGDMIRQLCEQIAQKVAARETQRKGRYGGLHLGTIASLAKLAKMKKVARQLGNLTPNLYNETQLEAVVTGDGLQLVEVLGGGLKKQRRVRKGKKGGSFGGGFGGGPM